MHNDKARCTSICIAAIISLAAAVAVAEVLPGASTGFEIRDTQPYTLYVKEPAQGTVDFASAAAALSGGSQAAAVTVIQPGSEAYSVQLYSQQIPFQAGSTYTTTIWMKADKDNVPVDFSWNSGPDSYTHLQGSEKTVIVSQVWQMFTMPTVSAAADGSYRLHLDFSKAGVPAGTTFYVDNIIVDREDAAAVETPPSVRAYSTDTVIVENSFKKDDPATQEGFRLCTLHGAKARAEYADHHSDAKESTGEYWARVTVMKPTATDWHIQLKNPRYVLEPGKTYRVSAKVRASINKAPFVMDFLTDKGYKVLKEDHFVASMGWETFSLSYKATKHVKVFNTIDIGGVPAGTYWDVDDLVVTEVEDKPAEPSAPMSKYYTDDKIRASADSFRTSVYPEDTTASSTLSAASTGFEAGTPNPYAGQVLAPAIGSIAFGSTAAAYEGSYCAAVTVSTPSQNEPWRIQMQSSMLDVTQGVRYVITARMRASAASVPVDFSLNSGSHGFATLEGSPKTVELGTEYALYDFGFTAGSSGAFRVHFDFGKAPAGTVVYLDNIQATVQG